MQIPGPCSYPTPGILVQLPPQVTVGQDFPSHLEEVNLGDTFTGSSGPSRGRSARHPQRQAPAGHRA